MTFLITGGAGFIGSHVVDMLISKGHTVHIEDDLSTGSRTNINHNSIFQGPRCCGTIRAEDIPRGSTVIHLAARPACNASMFAPVADTDNNYCAAVRFLKAAIVAGVSRIVLVSSMSVYGDAMPMPYVETLAPQPRDPYAINKFALELMVKSLAQSFGIEWVIVRPQHVFGPRQRNDLTYRNVIARWLRRSMARQTLPVIGSLSLRRAFSPIGLVVRGIVAAATLPQAASQIFNLGSPIIRSLQSLRNLIEEYCKHEVTMEFRPGPPTLAEECFGDVSKASAMLGIIELPDEFEVAFNAIADEIGLQQPISIREMEFVPELSGESYQCIYSH